MSKTTSLNVIPNSLLDCNKCKTIFKRCAKFNDVEDNKTYKGKILFVNLHVNENQHHTRSIKLGEDYQVISDIADDLGIPKSEWSLHYLIRCTSVDFEYLSAKEVRNIAKDCFPNFKNLLTICNPRVIFSINKEVSKILEKMEIDFKSLPDPSKVGGNSKLNYARYVTYMKTYA